MINIGFTISIVIIFIFLYAYALKISQCVDKCEYFSPSMNFLPVNDNYESSYDDKGDFNLPYYKPFFVSN